ncbi:MAG: App1 family protein [Taibaiella sp.]|nr:App1 family protein [Taibaiella sp.]
MAESNTLDGNKNPFFYVSSSEWNLYDYLSTVFREHELPKGVFLLHTLKYLKSFVTTGKSGHEGKLFRIARIIIAFPENQFVLLGDNSQRDPEIYAAIAEKYPQQIAHILIRNVSRDKETATRAFLKNAEHLGISTCLFATTQEAIAYCRDKGLIHDR